MLLNTWNSYEQCTAVTMDNGCKLACNPLDSVTTVYCDSSPRNEREAFMSGKHCEKIILRSIG